MKTVVTRSSQKKNITGITRLIRELNDGDSWLRIELSEDCAKSLAWRRTADTYKKLVGIGAFYIRKEQLESLRRLLRDVKPQEVGPYLTITGRQVRNRCSRGYFAEAFTTLFVVIRTTLRVEHMLN